jgi:hypothetical protein
VPRIRADFPDLVAPPPFLLADAVRLIQAETYDPFDQKHTKSGAARMAAYCALAVTIRLGLSDACGILLAQWRPGGRNVVVVGGEERPLLPIVVDVVESYVPHRPEGCGPWLFVTNWGTRASFSTFNNGFHRLGRHLGVIGGYIDHRLHAFFDRTFDGEADRAAVVALRGTRERAIDRGVPTFEIAAAAQDVERLRAVVEANHPFAGRPGAFKGTRARRLIQAGPRNLPRLRPLFASDAMLRHPLVRALQAETFPDPGQRHCCKHRNRLRRIYYAPIEALRRAKLLKASEVRHLFKIADGTELQWRRNIRLEGRSPEEAAIYKADNEKWRVRLVAAFRARPNGEKPKAFSERFLRETECPRPQIWVIAILRVEGLLPKSRGRPRKTGPRRQN